MQVLEMNDFAELGPLMLVVSPIPILCFAVAAVCGFASVWFHPRTDGVEFQLLTCGVGLWAAVRDLQIPMDVFLIATLPLSNGNVVSRTGYTVTAMGVVEWASKFEWNAYVVSSSAWHTWIPHTLLVFIYVASTSSVHRAAFRVVLALFRVWMPRNGVFITAVFVWSGRGGVFARLGSVLLVGLLGEYAAMTMAVAGVADYISSIW